MFQLIAVLITILGTHHRERALLHTRPRIVRQGAEDMVMTRGRSPELALSRSDPMVTPVHPSPIDAAD